MTQGFSALHWLIVAASLIGFALIVRFVICGVWRLTRRAIGGRQKRLNA